MSMASREDQRDRLLEAALVHVPFDGWSRRSLFAGDRDLGVEPGLARRSEERRVGKECRSRWSPDH